MITEALELISSFPSNALLTAAQDGTLSVSEVTVDVISVLFWWKKKENAIRYGSSLRVKDGEVAVFVYPGENGNQDFIEGPFFNLQSCVCFYGCKTCTLCDY